MGIPAVIGLIVTLVIYTICRWAVRLSLDFRGKKSDKNDKNTVQLPVLINPFDWKPRDGP